MLLDVILIVIAVFIALVLSWTSGVHASLLASSKLESCERGSATDNDKQLNCDKKITVLLSIEQEQKADAEAIVLSNLKVGGSGSGAGG